MTDANLSKKTPNHEKSEMFSLVAKIMLAIIAVLFLLSLILYLRVKKYEQEHFLDLGNYITAQSSDAITEWIEEQAKLASYIASDNRIIEACAEPSDADKRQLAVSFVEEIHRSFPEHENIGAVMGGKETVVISQKGQDVQVQPDTIFIDSVKGETLGKRNEMIPHISEFSDGVSFLVSPVYPSILRENPIIVITVPVKNGDEISGYIFVSPQIDSFVNKFLSKAFVNNSAYLFLADDRGLIVAHNNTDYVLNREFSDKTNTYFVRDQILAGEAIAKTTLHGVKKQYVGHEITFLEGRMQQRLFAVFTQDEKYIFRNARQILFSMLVSLAISLLMLLIYTYMAVKKSHRVLEKQNLIRMNKTLTDEVKKRTQQLQALAEGDALTGCLNHNTIYQVLETLIHSSKGQGAGFSIALLDLDDFKHVNDSYGHTTGDEVLRITAQTIQDCVRSNDVVGRYGGEEFLILMPDTNLSQARIIAERIRQAIEKNEFRPNQFHISASMGVCSHQDETSLDLVKHADQLLYKAKRLGKNQVISE